MSVDGRMCYNQLNSASGLSSEGPGGGGGSPSGTPYHVVYMLLVSDGWSSPNASSQHMIWCGMTVPSRSALMSLSSIDSVSDGGPRAHDDRMALLIVMSDGLTPLCMQKLSSHCKL